MEKVRHIGILTNTRERVVLAFMSLPNDPFYALGVKLDTLPDLLKTDLELLVHSSTGQDPNSRDLAIAMTNYRINLLKEFHEKGLLEKFHINQVTMTPAVGLEFPLRTIVDALRQQDRLPDLSTMMDPGAETSTSKPVTQPIPEVKPKTAKELAKENLEKIQNLQNQISELKAETLILDPSVIFDTQETLTVPTKETIVRVAKRTGAKHGQVKQAVAKTKKAK